MANFLTRAVDKVVSAAGGDLTPGFSLPDVSKAQPTGTYNSWGKNAPQVLGANTDSSGSGLSVLQNGTIGGGTTSGYGGTSSGTPVYNSQQTAFRNSLPSSLQNIRQTYGVDPFTTGRTTLLGDAKSLFNTQRAGQTAIDRGRANNELSRMNGVQDILGYVRNGMQQGGSRLAANNATESSASDALARAYNQIGNQKTRSVNNQAGLQTVQLDQSQQDLNSQTATGKEDFDRTRTNLVNNITTNLRYQLAQLDQQAQGLSIPDRIAVDQEKQTLIDAGQKQLQEVDQWLQDQLATITPESQDQVLADVQGLRAAGTASPNPFNTGDFSGQQVQGPAVAQLPLFTRNKKTD